MVLNSNLKKGFKHTYTVCVLLSIISASCNISGVNKIVKTSKNIKTITPIVCNLESLSSGANGIKLGFVNNTPIFRKHKYKASNLFNDELTKNLKEDDRQYGLNHRLESCLLAKPNAFEVSHAHAVNRGENRPETLNRLFTSPLDTLRDSMSKLTEHQAFGVTHKVLSLFLNHVVSLAYKNSFRQMMLLFPLRRTVMALQMLASLPVLSYRWLLGLQPLPSFNVQPYQLEKVDFRKEGLIRSVEKSLKNGYYRTKAYVKAYKTVLAQGAYFSVLHYLSTTRVLMKPEFEFLRAFEPLFVSFLTYLLEGKRLDSLTYLSLVPVVAGLLYSTHGKRLTAVSLLRTFKNPRVLAGCVPVLLYNLLSALQKLELRRFFDLNGDSMGKNLTPSNVGVLSQVLGALMFVPFALSESPYWRDVYHFVFKMIRGSTVDFLKHLALSSVYSSAMYFTSFEAMSNLSPVSQSLVNSLKTTLVGVLDSYFPNKKLHKHQLLGSSLAIAGALAYSLFND